jgi:predicted  nucleic acid-binding Zn-ribbon protein
MPTTLEERVAYLEGKVEEHSYAWQDLKEAIRETNQRITHMEQKFDQRFAQIDQRFAQIDQRFAQIDQRFAQIDQRIDKLFFFILATLASSIGALISALVSIFVR